MRPQDVQLELANGDDEEVSTVSSGADEGDGERAPGSADPSDAEAVEVVEPGYCSRLLAKLDALRKSRQHYDVVVVARGGAELAAHRAVLAAASPRLLRELAVEPPPSSLSLSDISAEELHALLDYMYSGKLVAGPGCALSLCRAAALLRLDAARDALLRRLLRCPTPAHALALRQLPGLPPEHRDQLDNYLAEHLDEVVGSGAASSLPTLQLEVVRDSAPAAAAELPPAVAAAALAWLKAQPSLHLDTLCNRTHQLYVDDVGLLQECGTAGGAAWGAGGPWRVVAARADAAGGTRALLAVPAGLLLARVAWRRGPDGAARLARGGEVAPLGGGRCAFGAAALAGRLVLCGGYDAQQVLNITEAYCPQDNAWHRLNDMRGARARFGAAAVNGVLYACGGSDGQSELSSVEAWDGGAWRRAAPLPAPAVHPAAVAAGSRLMLLGGWAAGRALRTTLFYDPEENKWSEGPMLNTARSGLAGAYWRGAVWALGGADAWRCLCSSEVLSVLDQSGHWEAGPSLLSARRAAAAVEWCGSLWLAGGSDGTTSLATTEYLESPEGAWAAGPRLRLARAAAALLALGGALYCLGGYSGREFLACAECLRAPHDRWTQLHDPPAPRRPLMENGVHKSPDSPNDSSDQNGKHADHSRGETPVEKTEKEQKSGEVAEQEKDTSLEAH